jgi:ribonucleoside-diphosphate reductase alpha chain
MYYLRSTAAADAIKFTLDKNAMQQPAESEVAPEIPSIQIPVVAEAQQTIAYAQNSLSDYDQKLSDMACSLDNPDACEACGS